MFHLVFHNLYVQTLEFQPRASNPGLQAQDFKPRIPKPGLRTRNPIPGPRTQESKPRTPNPGPQTQESKLRSQNPGIQTQESKPGIQTRSPKPGLQTQDSKSRTENLGLKTQESKPGLHVRESTLRNPKRESRQNVDHGKSGIQATCGPRISFQILIIIDFFQTQASKPGTPQDSKPRSPNTGFQTRDSKPRNPNQESKLAPQTQECNSRAPNPRL